MAADRTRPREARQTHRERNWHDEPTAAGLRPRIGGRVSIATSMPLTRTFSWKPCGQGDASVEGRRPAPRAAFRGSEAPPVRSGPPALLSRCDSAVLDGGIVVKRLCC